MYYFYTCHSSVLPPKGYRCSKALRTGVHTSHASTGDDMQRLADRVSKKAAVPHRGLTCEGSQRTAGTAAVLTEQQARRPPAGVPYQRARPASPAARASMLRPNTARYALLTQSSTLSFVKTSARLPGFTAAVASCVLNAAELHLDSCMLH